MEGKKSLELKAADLSRLVLHEFCQRKQYIHFAMATEHVWLLHAAHQQFI